MSLGHLVLYCFIENTLRWNRWDLLVVHNPNEGEGKLESWMLTVLYMWSSWYSPHLWLAGGRPRRLGQKRVLSYARYWWPGIEG